MAESKLETFHVTLHFQPPSPKNSGVLIYACEVSGGGKKAGECVFINHFGSIHSVAMGHRSFILGEQGPGLSVERYPQETALKELRRLKEKQEVGGDARDAFLLHSVLTSGRLLGSLWPNPEPSSLST